MNDSGGVSGDREIDARFAEFPNELHELLEQRIRSFIEELTGRIQAAAPFKTGRLRSEITNEVYNDSASRIAGYVSVYAPSMPSEYAKAATLEYGSSRARRMFEHSTARAAFGRARKRIVERMTRPVQIEARMYLRGPFAELQPEVEAAIAESVTQAQASA